MYSRKLAWGKCVGVLLESRGKTAVLSTASFDVSGGFGKVLGFATMFSSFFQGFFHYVFLTFASVNFQFLPIFNNTNKHNNVFN